MTLKAGRPFVAVREPGFAKADMVPDHGHHVAGLKHRILFGRIKYEIFALF